MRKEEQAALQHALDALGDGSGHDVWGPGPVGHKLHMSGHLLAAQAFDEASITLTQMLDSTALISRVGRPRFIAAMKKLAPVLLDILLPPEE
jgi:hypothetical protein